MVRERIVYHFRPGDVDASPLLTGKPDLADLLGKKGLKLAQMAAEGIPVPEGFTLSTEAAARILRSNAGLLESFQTGQISFHDLIGAARFPPDVDEALDGAFSRLEGITGRTFGSVERPLIVSVRAGANVSMPGMLDTLCNIGIPRALMTEDAPFWIWDAQRRFLEAYGTITDGVATEKLEAVKARHPTAAFGSMKERVRALLSIVHAPRDPRSTVRRVIRGLLFASHGERTAEYRRLNFMTGELRIGLTVQRMVFGNFNERSGAGVVFTRDPSTGEPYLDADGVRRLFGQFKLGGQGADVVDDLGDVRPIETLRDEFETVYAELERIFFGLERRERSVQDGEFTVEDGRLFVLQTRPSKMSPHGTLKSAVDLVEEGVAEKGEAAQLMDSLQLERLLYAKEQPAGFGSLERIGSGRPLVPGVAAGHIVFDAAEAQRYKSRNETVLLCRDHLRNEDIHLFDVVDGIISGQKNVSSHATLVARATGLPTITHAEPTIDPSRRRMRYHNASLAEVNLPEGTYVTLDATSGTLYRGYSPLRGTDLTDPTLNRFLSLLGDPAGLKVTTQAETKGAFEVARRLGAEGLGNFRSDVIFFKRETNFALCSLLMAREGEEETRQAALEDLLEREYAELFGFCGDEVGIRLIKHTMMEYFPTVPYEVRMLAQFLVAGRGGDPLDGRAVSRAEKAIREKRGSLADYNPIMGLRGVRLAMVYPRVFEAQLRAIFRAARVAGGEGRELSVDLHVPYLTLVDEFLSVKEWIGRIAREVGGGAVPWRAVPVIEVSGIALEAGELALNTDRILIRSDKLTTSTHHLVREDSDAFLGSYVERGWFFGDPFRIIQKSTERLVAQAIEAARSANPAISVVVAGDHCANEYSLRRLLHLGVTEVCAPPRLVPLVRLIALNLHRPPATPNAGGPP